MNRTKIYLILSQSLLFFIMLLIFFHIIQAFGMEEKTFLEKNYEFMIGSAATFGVIGGVLGAIFFVTFGAVGFVSGAIYGAVGLLSLMIGGALSGLGVGLGLGTLVSAFENPTDYKYNCFVILPVFGIWILLYIFLSRYLRNKMTQYLAPDENMSTIEHIK